MAYSVVSFAVNLYVLVSLSKYRKGEFTSERVISARART